MRYKGQQTTSVSTIQIIVMHDVVIGSNVSQDEDNAEVDSSAEVLLYPLGTRCTKLVCDILYMGEGERGKGTNCF